MLFYGWDLKSFIRVSSYYFLNVQTWGINFITRSCLGIRNEFFSVWGLLKLIKKKTLYFKMQNGYSSIGSTRRNENIFTAWESVFCIARESNGALDFHFYNSCP